MRRPVRDALSREGRWSMRDTKLQGTTVTELRGLLNGEDYRVMSLLAKDKWHMIISDQCVHISTIFLKKLKEC